VNYVARYSLCKCIGFTFTENIICPVDIGANLSPIFGTVEAGSRPDTLSTEDVLLFIVWYIIGDGIEIKKAGFAGIAFYILYFDQ